MTYNPNHFDSNRHALWCGLVMGTLIRQGAKVMGVTEPNPESGRPDYTCLVTVDIGEDRQAVLRILPPPEDWNSDAPI